MNSQEGIFSSRIAIVCRILLCVIFLYASAPKILAPDKFADVILRYHILPASMINLAAITLPWIELFAGFALIHNSLARSGGLILLVLNLIFLGAISSAIIRGLDISCGCFYLMGNSTVGWSDIARGVTLILLCMPILFQRTAARRS